MLTSGARYLGLTFDGGKFGQRCWTIGPQTSPVVRRADPRGRSATLHGGLRGCANWPRTRRELMRFRERVCGVFCNGATFRFVADRGRPGGGTDWPLLKNIWTRACVPFLFRRKRSVCVYLTRAKLSAGKAGGLLCTNILKFYCDCNYCKCTGAYVHCVYE